MISVAWNLLYDACSGILELDGKVCWDDERSNYWLKGVERPFLIRIVPQWLYFEI